ncbi:hypothetical protein KUTeg_018163 [Tegillarca granosa]|uniref:threonine--tRNA ligase n=1 Tax=Tegillarca granosa TaxID=220873 RepID=A0ABQ9EHA0_TEGGR|nr:hypothetical protein KUTeg_018163 [Tegillarca granosa]
MQSNVFKAKRISSIKAVRKNNLPTKSHVNMSFDLEASKAEKKKKGAGGDGDATQLKELKPPPDFIEHRNKLWDKLKKDQGLADNCVVAKVNGELWDLDRPFEKDATLQLVKFEDEEGQYVFWHSSAHMLGEAMERLYGGHLCYGPPIDGGFYYDMFVDGRMVSSNDYASIDNLTKTFVKEKQTYERLEMKKEDLLKMFEYNEFKKRIINERVKTPTTTVYKNGSLIDLCRGPHVRHTGKIKAFAVTKNSSTYWEGKADAESLQRIYGISFPDTKQLKEWKFQQEEAAKRDHRKIGREQELFFFHELSPGSCFFLPNGAHIYNKLMDFIREEYRKRGFQEVISPNMYNSKLWEISGHWQHYADNLFKFDVEKEKFGLKPMNCPGHCLMFDVRPRSWRELPLRMADFGVLHRNELSGALHGLTRIKEEIAGCLDFLQCVYSVFGFTFQLHLSTRPDDYLGELQMWDEAEKIDIIILDALKRPHQCATIQLDFQLPIRFNLSYVTGEEGAEKKRPVIIHRAILGSVERMIAVLCENYGGKWPFWLSPRQSIVIPVADAFSEYAFKIKKEIFEAGFFCEVDSDQSLTFNKKVLVGEKEVSNYTANVRTRDNKVHGEHSITKIIERFQEFQKTRCLDAEEKF